MDRQVFYLFAFPQSGCETESPAAIPLDAECWEEVMIDLEGPNAPADRDGNRYSMTYVCCLCQGMLLSLHRPRGILGNSKEVLGGENKIAH